MSKHRYSIMARPYGADVGTEVEICQCDTSPEALVEAAKKKTLKIDSGTKVIHVNKYDNVYFVDHQAQAAAG